MIPCNPNVTKNKKQVHYPNSISSYVNTMEKITYTERPILKQKLANEAWWFNEIKITDKNQQEQNSIHYLFSILSYEKVPLQRLRHILKQSNSIRKNN